MTLPVTLRQLEIFLAIARHGQLTLAARDLHLTQSATSMALAQLERMLGVPLFHRHGRQVALTERGRVLLAEAPELLDKVRALPGLLSGEGQELRGELRIAASTTVGRYLLAPAVAGFATKHSAVHVALSIGNAEAAIEAVATHRADVAYVEGSVFHAALDAAPWRTDRMCIVTGARVWRGRSHRLTRAALTELEWIMREPGSGTREVLEHALKGAGLPPPTERLRLNDSEAILQVVISGVGAACLSQLVVSEALRTKRIVELQAPSLTLTRTLWCATRRHSEPGPIQRAFSGFVGGGPSSSSPDSNK